MQLRPENETPTSAGRLTRVAFSGVSGYLIPTIIVLIPFALTLLVALLLRYELYYELSLINAPKTLATVSYVLATITGALAIYGLHRSNNPFRPMPHPSAMCYVIATLVCLVFPEVFHVTTEAVFLRSSQVFPLP